MRRTGPTWSRTIRARGPASRVSSARSMLFPSRRHRRFVPRWALRPMPSRVHTSACTGSRWRRSTAEGPAPRSSPMGGISDCRPAGCAADLLARLRRHADHRRRQPGAADRGVRCGCPARDRADHCLRDHQHRHRRGDGRGRHAQRQHPVRQRLHRHGGRGLPRERRLGHPLGGPHRLLVRPAADHVHRHLDDPGGRDAAARHRAG